MKAGLRVAWLVLLPLAIASLHAEEQIRSWNFRVYLDDKAIGYHRFTLHEQGEHRELQSTARFAVKVLFIKAYEYAHDATETWVGNCLQGLTARTDDNGKKLTATAQLQGATLHIANNASAYTLPGCVMSFAYWNPIMLQQTQLLNAQTGEYDRVNITDLGQASLSVRGVSTVSRHYRLTGSKLSIDLWYSTAGEWMALESTTDTGHRLRYELS